MHWWSNVEKHIDITIGFKCDQRKPTRGYVAKQRLRLTHSLFGIKTSLIIICGQHKIVDAKIDTSTLQYIVILYWKLLND